MKDLGPLIHKAIRRRDRLSSVTNALRLVNGRGDGLDGLLIDRYHKHLHVQVLNDQWHKQILLIQEALTAALAVDYLVVKIRRGLHFEAKELITGPSQTTVEEYGVKFKVDLNDGLNCGLFLDMRHNRRLAAGFAAGKKMLNCFAYTCSFGVHARKAGAAQVINTDISRKVLERGKDNYRLNGLPFSGAEFLRADSVSFLQRAIKKGQTYDLVILDPPSFARHEGKVFQVKRDLPKAVALSAAVLEPGGALLVTTNYSDLNHAGLERILSRGLNGRRVDGIERVGQDEDFVGTNSFKESYMVGLWVRFL
ncbi:MAG: class I SAM-dependent rRNA methyltransferase [Candidatus Omnitrophica bacterium]|nr:class I SAM-dependent rRNA methyltransferase [Candidatus Omnitrophota bacterium]